MYCPHTGTPGSLAPRATLPPPSVRLSAGGSPRTVHTLKASLSPLWCTLSAPPCACLSHQVTFQLGGKETKVTHTCHTCYIPTKHILYVSNKISDCGRLRVWVFSVRPFSCFIMTSSTSFVPHYIQAQRASLTGAGLIHDSGCDLISSFASSYLDLVVSGTRDLLTIYILIFQQIIMTRPLVGAGPRKSPELFFCVYLNKKILCKILSISFQAIFP